MKRLHKLRYEHSARTPLLAALVVILVSSCASQRGAQVRLELRDGQASTCLITGITDTNARFHFSDGSDITIDSVAIYSIRFPGSGAGAPVGALMGCVAGALIGIAVAPDEPGVIGRNLTAAAYGFIGGLLGIGTGAIVGNQVELSTMTYVLHSASDWQHIQAEFNRNSQDERQ